MEKSARATSSNRKKPLFFIAIERWGENGKWKMYVFVRISTFL
jgi:hypothetical protein